MAVDLLTPPPKTRQNHRLSLRITSHVDARLRRVAAARNCRPAELARRALELALEGIDP